MADHDHPEADYGEDGLPMPLPEETADPELEALEKKEEAKAVLHRAVWGEFLSTFLFIFSVCAAGINTHRSGAPTTIQGCVVTAFCGVAVIYSFADVSGAHFNPAVTFATFVTRKTSLNKCLMYFGAQMVGSIMASCFLIMVFNFRDFHAYTPIRPPHGLDEFRALLMEIILTFTLVYVIFAVAFDTVDSDNVKVLPTKDKGMTARNLTIFTTTGNSKAGFAPIAIGFTLGFLALLGGAVSGGAYNPVRVFGPALLANVWDGHWLYWFGDLLGGALAGLVQLKFSTKPNADDNKSDTQSETA